MQSCQKTCYMTDGCVAFQYSLDESRWYTYIWHKFYFMQSFFESSDCKLLASPTSGRKIKVGRYLTGIPKCPSGKPFKEQ